MSGFATPKLSTILDICAWTLEQDFGPFVGRRGNLEALPTMGSELTSKRKAAQAAVHAAAQAIAQDEGLDDEGFGLDEGSGPAPYMPTLPPGMQTSASTPQVHSFAKI